MSSLVLRVEVPVASFRPPLARDYQDTYPVPPPSTSFGMLLSLCGLGASSVELFSGTKLATGIEAISEPSTVLRKMRRDATTDRKKGTPGARPDYQELLTDLVLWYRIDDGSAEASLAEAVAASLKTPKDVSRYGALCLGESTSMVDAVTVEEVAPEELWVLRPDPTGTLSLTTWVNYADLSTTVSGRFVLERGALSADDAIELGDSGI